MSSHIGTKLHMSVFGESHGEGVGVILDGFPAGFAVDWDKLLAFQDRRRPGKNLTSTQRQEPDQPVILGGITDGVTNGAPIAMRIKNQDTRSKDYAEMLTAARPGHADYTGHIRYEGANDPRGGGHFSGRLTAPLVFAGGLCKQFLEARDIYVGAHLASVKDIWDQPYDPVDLTQEQLLLPGTREFPVLDQEKGKLMWDAIDHARLYQDSVGGVVEAAAIGLPAGIGNPMFDGIENRMAAVLFGIPGVKGLEFGAGFAASAMLGSNNNDEFYMKDGQVKTRTNHHGGILGGITSSMPLVLRAALKPTSSIAMEQNTVDYKNLVDTKLSVRGRHDPCIAVRAVPVVEAMVAFVLTDFLLDGKR